LQIPWRVSAWQEYSSHPAATFSKHNLRQKIFKESCRNYRHCPNTIQTVHSTSSGTSFFGIFDTARIPFTAPFSEQEKTWIDQRIKSQETRNYEGQVRIFWPDTRRGQVYDEMQNATVEGLIDNQIDILLTPDSWQFNPEPKKRWWRSPELRLEVIDWLILYIY
jgi:hypothetical protein